MFFLRGGEGIELRFVGSYDLSERIVGGVVNPTVPSQTEYILGFGIR